MPARREARGKVDEVGLADRYLALRLQVGDEGYALAERLFRTKISWEPLLSVRAAKRKLKVAEIPGDEPPRIGGKRKLKILKWGAAYYFQFIREMLCWK